MERSTPRHFPASGKLTVTLLVFFTATILWGLSLPGQPIAFQRGDANADSSHDLSDAIFTLHYLFGSGGKGSCEDAMDGNDDGVFGEIYISAETARRQAAEYETSLGDEYLRLVCHGLLHLFGFDHMKKSDEKEMKAREEQYLSLVGR